MVSVIMSQHTQRSVRNTVLVLFVTIAIALGAPTDVPTDQPTSRPTDAPSDMPTDFPTDFPSDVPTDSPTDSPSDMPTDFPTDIPTDIPTDFPTDTPTDIPTEVPSYAPTDTPTSIPTDVPTNLPTDTPTDAPTDSGSTTTDPTLTPTPTFAPTSAPTGPPMSAIVGSLKNSTSDGLCGYACEAAVISVFGTVCCCIIFAIGVILVKRNKSDHKDPDGSLAEWEKSSSHKEDTGFSNNSLLAMNARFHINSEYQPHLEVYSPDAAVIPPERFHNTFFLEGIENSGGQAIIVPAEANNYGATPVVSPKAKGSATSRQSHHVMYGQNFDLKLSKESSDALQMVFHCVPNRGLFLSDFARTAAEAIKFNLRWGMRVVSVNGKAFGAHTLPTDAVSTIAEEYQQHSTVTWTFNSYYPSVVAVLPVMVNRNGLEQLEEVLAEFSAEAAKRNMAFSSVNINLAYARAMPPLYGRHFELSGLPAIFVDMDYCGNSKAFSQAIEFQQVESFLRLGLPRTRVHAPRLLRQSNGTYGGVAFKCDAGRTTQKNEDMDIPIIAAIAEKDKHDPDSAAPSYSEVYVGWQVLVIDNTPTYRSNYERLTKGGSSRKAIRLCIRPCDIREPPRLRENRISFFELESSSERVDDFVITPSKSVRKSVASTSPGAAGGANYLRTPQGSVNVSPADRRQLGNNLHEVVNEFRGGGQMHLPGAPESPLTIAEDEPWYTPEDDEFNDAGRSPKFTGIAGVQMANGVDVSDGAMGSAPLSVNAEEMQLLASTDASGAAVAAAAAEAAKGMSAESTAGPLPPATPSPTQTTTAADQGGVVQEDSWPRPNRASATPTGALVVPTDVPSSVNSPPADPPVAVAVDDDDVDTVFGFGEESELEATPSVASAVPSLNKPASDQYASDEDELDVEIKSGEVRDVVEADKVVTPAAVSATPKSELEQKLEHRAMQKASHRNVPMKVNRAYATEAERIQAEANTDETNTRMADVTFDFSFGADSAPKDAVPRPGADTPTTDPVLSKVHPSIRASSTVSPAQPPKPFELKESFSGGPSRQPSKPFELKKNYSSPATKQTSKPFELKKSYSSGLSNQTPKPFELKKSFGGGTSAPKPSVAAAPVTPTSIHTTPPSPPPPNTSTTPVGQTEPKPVSVVVPTRSGPRLPLVRKLSAKEFAVPEAERQRKEASVEETNARLADLSFDFSFD